MIKLSEIKAGDNIVIIYRGVPCSFEVSKVEGELIYTTDGSIWNRDDGSRAFWQSHICDAHISQDPKKWEWLAAIEKQIDANEKRNQRKKNWLKTHRPGQKKKTR